MSIEGSEYPKSRIRYAGPAGSHTVVGLATRTKYGRHEYGDVFWAFNSDIEANPEYFIVLDDGDGGSAAESLPKTPDAIRMPEAVPPAPDLEQIEQTVKAALDAPASLPESLPDFVPGVGWVPAEQQVEASPAVVPDWVASLGEEAPAPAAPKLPAALVPLDQIGVSERVAATLSNVGLIAVSDVLKLLEDGGEEALDAIDGIGPASVREVVDALTAHGYLEA